MPLCRVCVSALLEVEKTHDEKVRQGIFPTCTPHHHSFFVSFRDAVQVSQCLICKIISRAVPQLSAHDFMLNTDVNPYEINFREILTTGGKPTEMRVTITDQRDIGIPRGASPRGMRGSRTTITMTCLDFNLFLPSQREESVLANFTGANSILFKLRFWLHQCESNHNACRKASIDSNQLPSRLLDLQPSNLPNGYFKVIENCNSGNATMRYATLSHRWGLWKEEAWLLNDSTRERLISGESISNLPKTYQDALHVAKFLNVRYFWIDSLCIEQGDSLDIVSEAQKMASVYGNAVFNIAALEARHDGLFNTRDGSAANPFSAVIDSDKYRLSRSYIVLDDRFMDQVFLTPLSKRGWILQEQVLPKRIVYFGKDQIFWSCLENDFCEMYPVLSPLAWLLPHPQEQHDMLAVRRICSGIDSVENDITPQHWKSLINQFTLRDLTDPYDRLLAISGLASPFKNLLKDELVAGHWKSSLPSSLLWTIRLSIHSEGRPLSRLKGLPTWSWASCYHPSSFLPDPNQRSLAQVTHIETLESDLAAEHIKVGNTGALHLRAAALSVIYSVEEGAKSFNPRLPPGFDESPDKMNYKPPPRNPGSSKLLGGSSEVSVLAIYDFEDCREVEENDEQLAVFVSYQTTSYTLVDAGILHGLILRRRSGASTPYQRIGTFRIFINSVHSHLKDPQQPFVQLFLKWRFLEYSSADPPGERPEIMEPYDFNAASEFMDTYVIA